MKRSLIMIAAAIISSSWAQAAPSCGDAAMNLINSGNYIDSYTSSAQLALVNDAIKICAANLNEGDAKSLNALLERCESKPNKTGYRDQIIYATCRGSALTVIVSPSL